MKSTLPQGADFLRYFFRAQKYFMLPFWPVAANLEADVI
jgi:hypothetical protein